MRIGTQNSHSHCAALLQQQIDYLLGQRKHRHSTSVDPMEVATKSAPVVCRSASEIFLAPSTGGNEDFE